MSSGQAAADGRPSSLPAPPAHGWRTSNLAPSLAPSLTHLGTQSAWPSPRWWESHIPLLPAALGSAAGPAACPAPPQGVKEYEPRVVQQLTDFAYRYTADVLQEAQVGAGGCWWVSQWRAGIGVGAVWHVGAGWLLRGASSGFLTHGLLACFLVGAAAAAAHTWPAAAHPTSNSSACSPHPCLPALHLPPQAVAERAGGPRGQVSLQDLLLATQVGAMV